MRGTPRSRSPKPASYAHAESVRFPTTSNAEFVIVDSDHELTLGVLPPDNAERARITAVVDDLPIIAVGALVRGSSLRKNFITMVMTAMLFLVRNELASRVSFCKNEMELALWIAGQVPRAPPASALADVLSRL